MMPKNQDTDAKKMDVLKDSLENRIHYELEHYVKIDHEVPVELLEVMRKILVYIGDIDKTL